jgi:hypothetical protein
MKPFITGLLKGRITRRSMLAAALPAAGMSLALAEEAADGIRGKGHFRLGGAWVGSDDAGLVLNHVQIPLDPEGKTAALRVSSLSYGPSIAGSLTLLQADSESDFVGQLNMISHDTAQGRIVGCAIASGNPPVITAIIVVSGLFQFTDPDTMVANYTYSIFPPSADGLPHGDPLPPGPVPAPLLTLKRLAL